MDTLELLSIRVLALILPQTDTNCDKNDFIMDLSRTNLR